jgi:hypothetical protein
LQDFALRPIVEETLDKLTEAVAKLLRSSLQSHKWEPVLQAALIPLMRDVDVRHTGGAGEKGVDPEIHVPNPFTPNCPWVVAVQVKDYDGTVEKDVAINWNRRSDRVESRMGNQAVAGGLFIRHWELRTSSP